MVATALYEGGGEMVGASMESDTENLTDWCRGVVCFCRYKEIVSINPKSLPSKKLNEDRKSEY